MIMEFNSIGNMCNISISPKLIHCSTSDGHGSVVKHTGITARSSLKALLDMSGGVIEKTMRSCSIPAVVKLYVNCVDEMHTLTLRPAALNPVTFTFLSIAISPEYDIQV
jgi:hypothetical protein